MLSLLQKYDPEISEIIQKETVRQGKCIRLIASENYVSKAVMEATGSCLTNKYSEGYPGKRYYQGQEFTDMIENLAIARAKKVFGADHANVQASSGSATNTATYNALLDPGDTIMGLSLPDGGHLTHGWKVSATSKFFNSVSYNVDPETGLFDFDKIAEVAKACKPKIIVSGATAYPRIIDFEKFAAIAQDVGAYLLSDMAHIAGLVAGGVHPSPVPFADVVTTTTHKTLRGPRGGLIMCKEEHAKAIDRSIFPGLQGGPHMHTIAAIAIALGEADTEQFKLYAKQIVKNAKALAEKLMEHGFDLVSGGTDNHLILIDLRNKGVAGNAMAKAMNKANIVSNSNTVPNDTASPFNPSGLRIGTAAVTTRNMTEEQMAMIAGFMKEIVENVENEAVIERIGKEVEALCEQFPVPDYFVG